METLRGLLLAVREACAVLADKRRGKNRHYTMASSDSASRPLRIISTATIEISNISMGDEMAIGPTR